MLNVPSTKPTVSGGNLLTLDDNGVQSSKASFDRPNNSECRGFINAFSRCSATTEISSKKLSKIVIYL